jgi:phosphohistidine phosphatase
VDIWILRHAVAEDRSKTGRDEDRELTEDGTRRARDVGRGLAALEPGISRIVTSPYRRARQTAEAAAAALGLEHALTESRALEPDRDPEDILHEVAGGAAAGEGDVLLVGHQPHLGELLGLLVGGPGVDMPLKKAATARVTLTGRWSGAMKAYLPAPILEKLGRHGRGSS